jgi:hypothetical protein
MHQQFSHSWMAIFALMLTIADSQIVVAKPAMAQPLSTKTAVRIAPQRQTILTRTSFNPMKTKVPTPQPKNSKSRQAIARKNSAPEQQANGISKFTNSAAIENRNTDLSPVDRWTK